MYTLKNKSNNILDILGRKIHPSEEIQVKNLNPYKKLIQTGFLKVIKDTTTQELIILPKQNVTRQVINNINTNHKILNKINNLFPLSPMIEDEEKIITVNEEKNVNEEKTDIDEKINIEEKIEEKFNELKETLLKQNKELIDKLIIKESIDKNEILNSLFHFYIDKELTKKDLDNVKYFFLNISELKSIAVAFKTEILNSSSYEELITILLNNIYPLLFKE